VLYATDSMKDLLSLGRITAILLQGLRLYSLPERCRFFPPSK